MRASSSGAADFMVASEPVRSSEEREPLRCLDDLAPTRRAPGTVESAGAAPGVAIRAIRAGDLDPGDVHAPDALHRLLVGGARAGVELPHPAVDVVFDGLRRWPAPEVIDRALRVDRVARCSGHSVLGHAASARGRATTLSVGTSSISRAAASVPARAGGDSEPEFSDEMGAAGVEARGRRARSNSKGGTTTRCSRGSRVLPAARRRLGRMVPEGKGPVRNGVIANRRRVGPCRGDSQGLVQGEIRRRCGLVCLFDGFRRRADIAVVSIPANWEAPETLAEGAGVIVGFQTENRWRQIPVIEQRNKPGAAFPLLLLVTAQQKEIVIHCAGRLVPVVDIERKYPAPGVFVRPEASQRRGPIKDRRHHPDQRAA